MVAKKIRCMYAHAMVTKKIACVYLLLLRTRYLRHSKNWFADDISDNARMLGHLPRFNFLQDMNRQFGPGASDFV